MAKRHKKHKHEDHVDESWLVPYADILTLLLALFIVLFASSTVDQKKLNEMSTVFNSIFMGGQGVMEYPSPVEPIDSEITTKNPTGAQSAYDMDQKELQEIQASVDNFIAVNELEDSFETTMTDEGLLVTIRDGVLFAPASATIAQENRALANELSSLLVFDPARNIVITGHTDDVPISSSAFESNWELSVMRSVNFLKLLIDANPQLDPLHFSAKGYGEYHPIASNDTAEGRAQNRRVEVLIQQRVLEDGTEIEVENETTVPAEGNDSSN
ncbi:MAG: flagellar motor protein MotB [Caryophanon sp.]|nr:flagellar motor protein MotB [Caryophanon sp.]